MKRHRFGLIALSVSWAWSGLVLAEGRVGDPAPPLEIEKWVKGDPIDLAKGKGKNLYVVEFWATWCGPCIAMMPHMTEMQKKYEEGECSDLDRHLIYVLLSFLQAKENGDDNL